MRTRAPPSPRVRAPSRSPPRDDASRATPRISYARDARGNDAGTRSPPHSSPPFRRRLIRRRAQGRREHAFVAAAFVFVFALAARRGVVLSRVALDGDESRFDVGDFVALSTSPPTFPSPARDRPVRLRVRDRPPPSARAPRADGRSSRRSPPPRNRRTTRLVSVSRGDERTPPSSRARAPRGTPPRGGAAAHRSSSSFGVRSAVARRSMIDDALPRAPAFPRRIDDAVRGGGERRFEAEGRRFEAERRSDTRATRSDTRAPFGAGIRRSRDASRTTRPSRRYGNTPNPAPKNPTARFAPRSAACGEAPLPDRPEPVLVARLERVRTPLWAPSAPKPPNVFSPRRPAAERPLSSSRDARRRVRQTPSTVWCASERRARRTRRRVRACGATRETFSRARRGYVSGRGGGWASKSLHRVSGLTLADGGGGGAISASRRRAGGCRASSAARARVVEEEGDSRGVAGTTERLGLRTPPRGPLVASRVDSCHHAEGIGEDVSGAGSGDARARGSGKTCADGIGEDVRGGDRGRRSGTLTRRASLLSSHPKTSPGGEPRAHLPVARSRVCIQSSPSGIAHRHAPLGGRGRGGRRDAVVTRASLRDVRVFGGSRGSTPVRGGRGTRFQHARVGFPLENASRTTRRDVRRAPRTDANPPRAWSTAA